MILRSRAARVLRSRCSDRGSNVVELAVLAPGLMMICMLILQFGLRFLLPTELLFLALRQPRPEI